MCQLGIGHVGWKDTIVHKMIIIVGFSIGDDDSFEPLDHAAAGEPRNDHPNRKAVVWRDRVAVLLVGYYDVSCWVHCHFSSYAGAVAAAAAAGEIIGAFHPNV